MHWLINSLLLMLNFAGKRVNLRQLIGGNPDRDGFLGILLG